METKHFYLHALSVLHVGVGQAVGVVDLPIARCRATNLPLVPGSAVKGVLRDEFSGATEHQEVLFGPESITDDASAYASALAFGDAHLLVFPVRSFSGIVAFATCPFVLERYGADLKRCGVSNIPSEMPEPAAGAVAATSTTVLQISTNRILLEDLDFQATPEAVADNWAEHLAQAIHPEDEIAAAHFQKRFVVMTDDDFTFLTDTATEVRPRNRIDPKRGVVQRGALWYEENLPAESVLWGMMAAGPSRMKSRVMTVQEIWQCFDQVIAGERLIQIGGKATVGRGLVRFLRSLQGERSVTNAPNM